MPLYPLYSDREIEPISLYPLMAASHIDDDLVATPSACNLETSHCTELSLIFITRRLSKLSPDLQPSALPLFHTQMLMNIYQGMYVTTEGG